MSEHLQVEMLGAFLEGALPEHERAECLAHLAECGQCREIVFAAQAAPAASAPVPIRRKWLAPMPILAAAAGVAAVAVGLYLHSRGGTPPPVNVARVERPLEVAGPTGAQGVAGVPPGVAPPVSVGRVGRPAEVAGVKGAPRAKVDGPTGAPGVAGPEPRSTAVDVVSVTPRPVGTPAGAAEPTKVAAATGPVARQTAESVAVTAEAAAVATVDPDMAGVAGTVVDPSGGVIAGAEVELRPAGATESRNARTDPSGRFRFSGLLPGRYELKIVANGFRILLMVMNLRPREVAALKPELQIGAVAETVEVTAGVVRLETSNAEVGVVRSRKKAPPPAPRAAQITVTSGKVTLAVDFDGAVFRSTNAGKSWSRVKAVWTGKIDELRLAEPQTRTAVFELTTESGAAWLSRDGSRWSPAPSRR